MKILIWGTGRICTRVIMDIPNDRIVGYIDSKRAGTIYAGKKLYRPDDISEIEYDAIIVATVYGDEIYNICKEKNIDLKKVIFAYGNIAIRDLNQDYDFISEICGKEYTYIIKNRYHLAREENYISKPLHFKMYDFKDSTTVRNDYMRVKAFELLVAEIDCRGIAGNTAELGVFRGEFAQYINAAFPERKCYLFDTFEGFNENELLSDFSENDVQNVFRDFFKETTLKVVMDKMLYPDKIVVKKGFFPESLNGLEDKFCFVSLDADLEETLFRGLEYFYPRLNEGGYIMIHDYNVLDSAHKSIDKYEKENNIKLSKIPIFDANGSIVITK